MDEIVAITFGEGNFLRAFVGEMYQRMNIGKIVAVQGLETGMADKINAANGKYNIVLRGGTKQSPVEKAVPVEVLGGCINPYADYGSLLALAGVKSLAAVYSNTTEAGIEYLFEPLGAKMHRNYPNKLTRFLLERYTALGADATLDIIPMELIEHNGVKLREIVLRVAKEWGLTDGFTEYIKACRFYETLVDRIVSGYRQDAAQKYNDSLADVCEPFFLLVIRGEKSLFERVPLDKSGLGVILTEELELYRNRKVRILNGAHTTLTPIALLCGKQTVEEAVTDATLGRYLYAATYGEIIPSFDGEGLVEYAGEVLERFKNPFLGHKLESIALNSVSKFVTRVLVSIKDYAEKHGTAPKILCFALAALIRFYEIDGRVNDSPEVVSLLKEKLKGGVTAVLKETELWGEDLTMISGLNERVTAAYESIAGCGAKKALEELMR